MGFGAPKKLWPFMSPLDEALGCSSAGLVGQAWPFAPSQQDLQKHLIEADLHGCDLVLIAQSFERLWKEEQKTARGILLQARTQGTDKLSTTALASVVRGLRRTAATDPELAEFVQTAVQALADRRKTLRAAHAATLLSVLGANGGNGKPLASARPVLELAVASLREHAERSTLELDDMVAALEGLGRTRAARIDDATEVLVGEAAAALVPYLRGGHGLTCIVAAAMTPHSRGLTLRLLGSLWSLPEALSQDQVSRCFALLVGTRWPRGLPPNASEEHVAAAGCALARCGGWASTRAGFLLAQALHRQRRALKARLAEEERLAAEKAKTEKEAAEKAKTDKEAAKEGDDGAEQSALKAVEAVEVSRSAALWLCAVAQSGRALDAATDKPEAPLAEIAEESLLGSLAFLRQPAPAGTAYDSLSGARALWALCSLGKAESEHATEILAQLVEADAARFCTETWALLREAGHTLAAPAAAEASEANDGEAQEEAGFGSRLWQDCLASAGAGEERRWAASGRLAELRRALEASGEELSEVEEGFAVGPYKVALHVGSHSVAIDFDCHQGVQSRCLRRQQWAALCPDVRVAEITLASWDGLDEAARAGLVRRRLLNEEDPVDEDEDED